MGAMEHHGELIVLAIALLSSTIQEYYGGSKGKSTQSPQEK